MRQLIRNLLLATCLAGAGSSVAAAPLELSFGIVPQQAASKLARLWGPVIAHLSELSGYRIVFKTAPSIPEFETRLAAGEYDIAYMNPYHFTVFKQKPGYRALARQSDKRIKGILVVRKDSPISQLGELNGQLLAFPAPAAFGASVLPRSELKQQGIDFVPQYVSSHDSVYRSVAKGLFPAGGGIQRTFDNLAPRVREQLRVLWTTKGYTPHAIACHPRISQHVIEKLRETLLAMNDSDQGRALLAAIRFEGIEAASDSDWDDVRDLDIKLQTGLSH